ncbi:hypothetical protein RF11_09728 [Thelohanellus kitauei]|uniref:Cystatin domain-containing protein n=1 Tax=Thelohanellus kitauei TaxID=669202 RepID=A0A0C2JST4_THEKT|nr:hypothetical protein RF11_09728 [Thelohanellus kitauei]
MFKVGVLLLVFTKIDCEPFGAGGASEFHIPSEKEQSVFDQMKETLWDGTSGLEGLMCYQLELLKGPRKVEVKTEVAGGENLLFKIWTTSRKTPMLYMKVSQELPTEPPIEVLFLETQPPQ